MRRLDRAMLILDGIEVLSAGQVSELKQATQNAGIRVLAIVSVILRPVTCAQQHDLGQSKFAVQFFLLSSQVDP